MVQSPNAIDRLIKAPLVHRSIVTIVMNVRVCLSTSILVINSTVACLTGWGSHGHDGMRNAYLLQTWSGYFSNCI